MELPSYAIRSTIPARRLQNPTQGRFRPEEEAAAPKPVLGAPPLPPRPLGFGAAFTDGATSNTGEVGQTLAVQQASATYQAAKSIVSTE